MTLEQLKSYTLDTIPAFDENNAIGSHFVGWQCGFEPVFIEVQFCDSIHVSESDAMEIAEEHMISLDRGFNEESDLHHVVKF